MEISLITFFGRIIELLAFYLILANIDGFDGMSLKESFVRLFRTKQKILYGNIPILVLYPIFIVFLVYTLPIPMYGFLIDGLMRPFVAYFLLRRVFNFKNALLSNLLSFACAFPITLLSLFIPISLLMLYLTTLVIIIIIAHYRYFKNFYVYLTRKAWLFYTLCALSLMMYGISVLVEFSILLGTTLFLLFLIIATYLHIKNRTDISTTMNELQNATADNLFKILKKISTEYTEIPTFNQYIINGNSVNQITPALLTVLDKHQQAGVFKIYEYEEEKWKIKINVFF